MCRGREHRYNVQVQVGQHTHQVVVYAKGVAEAIAKADGWAHIHLPGQFYTFTITHSAYHTVESAEEHGALLPTPYQPDWPNWVKVAAES